MHTGEANLAKSDYDDYINDFKDIGQRFQVINGETNVNYMIQIEKIHNTHCNTNKVVDIVIQYEIYVKMVLKIEMSASVMENPAPVKESPASIIESPALSMLLLSLRARALLYMLPLSSHSIR